jgi:hypothetical protein
MRQGYRIKSDLNHKGHEAHKEQDKNLLVLLLRG